MKKKTAEPRRARVSLSPKNLEQLLYGESLHIRLRNVAGEEQILELQSPLPTAQTKKLTNRIENLMEQIDTLMTITNRRSEAENGRKRVQ